MCHLLSVLAIYPQATGTRPFNTSALFLQYRYFVCRIGLTLVSTDDQLYLAPHVDPSPLDIADHGAYAIQREGLSQVFDALLTKAQ
jgi:hypothetical protein